MFETLNELAVFVLAVQILDKVHTLEMALAPRECVTDEKRDDHDDGVEDSEEEV